MSKEGLTLLADVVEVRGRLPGHPLAAPAAGAGPSPALADLLLLIPMRHQLLLLAAAGIRQALQEALLVAECTLPQALPLPSPLQTQAETDREGDLVAQPSLPLRPPVAHGMGLTMRPPSCAGAGRFLALLPLVESE